ncbi:MAG: SIS domain-containing protein [Bacteroidia bacterium]
MAIDNSFPTTDPINDYLDKCGQILNRVREQKQLIETAAQWFSQSILAGRMVHVFGSGHSRIMVEEMWPRYGSFPGFNPIVELSLTFHNLVTGANGQRQAMFLENVPGLAGRILRNFDLSAQDTALVISSSGTNIVPVEIAEEFKNQNIRVVALITEEHSARSTSKRSDGKKLGDFADLILDTGAPAGDSMVRVQGLETPVSPGSTVGGAMMINAIKAETARLLTENGVPPKVLTATCLVGTEKATNLFESAYDEHAHRMARLFAEVGKKIS